MYNHIIGWQTTPRWELMQSYKWANIWTYRWRRVWSTTISELMFYESCPIVCTHLSIHIMFRYASFHLSHCKIKSCSHLTFHFIPSSLSLLTILFYLFFFSSLPCANQILSRFTILSYSEIIVKPFSLYKSQWLNAIIVRRIINHLSFIFQVVSHLLLLHSQLLFSIVMFRQHLSNRLPLIINHVSTLVNRLHKGKHVHNHNVSG